MLWRYFDEEMPYFIFYTFIITFILYYMLISAWQSASDKHDATPSRETVVQKKSDCLETMRSLRPP